MCRKPFLVLLSFAFGMVAGLGAITAIWPVCITVWPQVHMDYVSWPSAPGQTVAFVDSGVLSVTHVGSAPQENCGLTAPDAFAFSYSSQPLAQGTPLKEHRCQYAGVPLLLIAVLLGLWPAVHAFRLARRSRRSVAVNKAQAAQEAVPAARGAVLA